MKYKEVIKEYESPGAERQPYEKWLDYKGRMRFEKVLQKLRLKGEPR